MVALFDPSYAQQVPNTTVRYLSVVPRTVVFAAEITEISVDPVLGTVFRLGYTTSTGDATKTYADMTVRVRRGSVAGEEIAYTRLRRGVDDGIKKIFISEVAAGDLDIQVGDYAVVYDEYIPQIKPIRLQAIASNGSSVPTDFIEYHDYDEIYSNQNDAIKPIVNIHDEDTPSLAGRYRPFRYADWVDENQPYRTMTLKFTLEPTGNPSPVSTIFWDLKDGTLVASSADNTSKTVQFPVGFRYVRLTVVLADNSATTKHIPVWVHDTETYPPIPEGELGFVVTSDETSLESGGRKLELTIHNRLISQNAFPEGACVCLWKTYPTYHDASKMWFRHSFLGWCFEETRGLQDTEEIRVNVGNVGIWMTRMEGFGTQLNHVNSKPTKWYEINGLTLNRYVHYILREYTSILTVCNFYPSPEPAAYSLREHFEKDTIYAQCNTVAQSYEMHVCMTDSASSIYLFRNPHYLTYGDYNTTDERSLLPIMAELTSQDVTAEELPEYTWKPENEVSVVNATGAYWGEGWNEPKLVASRAPGKTPSLYGGSPEELLLQRLVLPPTDYQRKANDRLNILVGLHYAHKNSKWNGTSFVIPHLMDVFEIAYCPILKMTFNEINPRSLTIDPNDLWFVSSIDILYQDSGDEHYKIILERLEKGPPGVDIPIPVGEGQDNPLWDFFFTVNPPVTNLQNAQRQPIYDDETGLPVGFALAVDRENNVVIRTFNYTDMQPNWEDITPEMPVDYVVQSGAGRFDAVSGIFTVKVVAYHETTNTAKIYHSTTTMNEIVAWTEEDSFTVTGSSVFFNAIRIKTSLSVDLWCVAWLRGDGVRVRRSNAYGVWNTTSVGENTALDPNIEHLDIGFDLEDHYIVISAKDGAGTYRLYRAQDLGVFEVIPGSPTRSKPFVCVRTKGDTSTVYCSSWNSSYTGSESTSLGSYSTLTNNVTWYYQDNTIRTDSMNQSSTTPQSIGLLTTTENNQRVTYDKTFEFDNDAVEATLSVGGVDMYFLTNSNAPYPSIPSSHLLWEWSFFIRVFTEQHGQYTFQGTCKWYGGYWVALPNVLPPPTYKQTLFPDTLEVTGVNSSLITLSELREDATNRITPFRIVRVVSECSGFKYYDPPSPMYYPTYYSLRAPGTFQYMKKTYTDSWSVFQKCDGYRTAIAFSDITPDDKLVPYGSNSITVHPLDTISYVGRRLTSPQEWREARKYNVMTQKWHTYQIDASGLEGTSSLGDMLNVWGTSNMALRYQNMYFASRLGNRVNNLPAEFRDLISAVVFI